MLKIDYTDHSSERLKERRISKEEIEMAIWNGIKSDTGNGLRKSSFRNQKGILVVIYRIRNAEEVIIITAYREE